MSSNDSTGPSSKPSQRRRVLLFLLLPALLLLFFVWIGSAWLGKKVPVVVASRQDLVETLVVNGRVLAPSRASLGAQVTGTVQEVLVIEGAHVLKGQFLVKLDEDEARAALGKAKAELTQAEARLQQMREVRSRLSAQSLLQAKVNLDQSERKVERIRSLRVRQLVSKSEMEDAEQEFDLAKSRVTSAGLEAASTLPGGVEDRLTSAGLEAARSALESAQIRLAKSNVDAPANGTILTRSVEPGDVVQPGKVLFTMALDRDVQLLAQPDEKNLRALRAGQKALASADAFPAQPFAAVVSYISPAVDLARGTVDVKFEVKDPPEFLRPDMTLSIDIDVARKGQALAIPLSAIRDLSREPSVLVIEGRKAQKRLVKLGIRSMEWAEVLSGLSEGDRVILPAKQRIEAGMRVRAER